MYRPVLKSLSRILVSTALAGFSLGLVAQDAPKPAKKATPSADSPSRWDIFAGYSYLAPKGTVDVLQQDGVTVLPESYKASDAGAIGSVAYYFNKYFGAQLESSTHDTMRNSSGSNSGFTTVQTGLIFRFPTDEIVPFAHGLVGATDIGGPEHEPYKWGVSLTAGGGLDYETPFFNHHLAIRLFQADFQYMHDNWGPSHT